MMAGFTHRDLARLVDELVRYQDMNKALEAKAAKYDALETELADSRALNVRLGGLIDDAESGSQELLESRDELRQKYDALEIRNAKLRLALEETLIAFNTTGAIGFYAQNALRGGGMSDIPEEPFPWPYCPDCDSEFACNCERDKITALTNALICARNTLKNLLADGCHHSSEVEAAIKMAEKALEATK